AAGKYSLLVNGVSTDGTKTQIQKIPFVVR
ncbi:MAG: hypothetical protein JWN02_725, partial [Acidobacteria bacterium]|nr:hypothetical protein [Acidobacteriota bacterium]